MEKVVVTVVESPDGPPGKANRDIQAAIDYVSYLGGGTVRIGRGVFELETAIHLRSHVKLEGTPGETVLRQREERVSPLAADADLHERQVTVERPDVFPVGQTITIRKATASMGFGDTVAVVTAKEGNTLYLDREIVSTVLLANGGIATTQTSVISAYDCERIEIRNLIVEGKKSNALAEGCRNAGIYLYGSHNVVIEGCTVRDYNGDGISYQHCSAIRVQACECVRNGGKGIHPGSGTVDTLIRDSVFNENGMDGIFLCWRVQDSVVEHNEAVGNRANGLSIGHKDVRNVIRYNRFSDNGYYGIFFRNEGEPMAANYNRVEWNTIEDNGSEAMGYVGIRIRGHTHHVEFVANRISFGKAPRDRTIGICMEEHTRDLLLEDNEFVGCALPTHHHWLPEGE
ncbi:right-handed parallel beta-helix repeat-containing protein [Paenibacillus sp.]|uniref:right-handed parallel beta-helix repeat-containing protein n=1 Tax=Paenibacillus sp. TaxID=58172 RepID=UPI002810D515|nr:right-handed parallel beta-helix repeat-containing protein [Paenibacillus sp.]